jgi:hypothetical protein
MVSQVFKFQLPVVVLLTLSAVALVPAGAARVVGSSGRVYSSFAEFGAAGKRCGTTASPAGRLLEVEEEVGRNLRGNSSRQLGKCRPALTGGWYLLTYPAVSSAAPPRCSRHCRRIINFLKLAAKSRPQLEATVPAPVGTHSPTHPPTHFCQ